MPTQIDYEVVPRSRTIRLLYSKDGLIGEYAGTVVVGVPSTWALDFHHDMPVNAQIANVADPVFVSEGSPAGMTFPDKGSHGSQAKLNISATAAGTYTFDVVVTYDGSGVQARGRVSVLAVE